MRSRFLATAAALALTGATLLATGTPASARWWHNGWGFAPGFAAGALIGGAVASTWPHAYASTWPNGYYDYGYDYGYSDYAYVPAERYVAPAPPVVTTSPAYTYGETYTSAPRYGYYAAPSYTESYAYVPGSGFEVRDQAYCMRRYRSFDPRSGTYLGFDGLRHPCP